MQYSALVMFYGLDLVIVHDFVLLNVKSPSKKKKTKTNQSVSSVQTYIQNMQCLCFSLALLCHLLH